MGMRSDGRARATALLANDVFAQPVGDFGPCSLDNGNDRQEVPGLQDGVAHDVCPAGCQEHVAIAVTPGAVQGGGMNEAFPTLGALVAFHRVGVRDEQGGFGERALAHANRLAVEPAGMVVAHTEASEDGLMNGAENGLAAVEEPNERCEKRHARDEAFGAIDGIEDPEEVGVDVFLPEFFAKDAVVGVTFVDERPHPVFGSAIGNRDGRGIFFRIDGEAVIAKAGEDFTRASLSERFNESDVAGGIHGAWRKRGGLWSSGVWHTL